MMKMKKELMVLGVAFLIASYNNPLKAFGAGGGPGQGNYPPEDYGFIPNAQWPAKDKTGMTYLNDLRTQQEEKTYGPATSSTVKKQSLNEDLLNELEQRIMKDIEAKVAINKKDKSLENKRSGHTSKSSEFEEKIKEAL